MDDLFLDIFTKSGIPKGEESHCHVVKDHSDSDIFTKSGIR